MSRQKPTTLNRKQKHGLKRLADHANRDMKKLKPYTEGTKILVKLGKLTYIWWAPSMVWQIYYG